MYNPSFVGWYAAFDLTQTMTQSNLKDLQSVWIDNSVNPGYIQLVNGSSGQVIFCDAFSQGVYPIFTAPGTQSSSWKIISSDRTLGFGDVSFIEQSIAEVSLLMPGFNQVDANITLVFTDATMPLAQWNYKSRGCQCYDISGTILNAGGFQLVMAVAGTVTRQLQSSAYRRGFLIQNPPAATEVLYVALYSNALNEPAPTAANSIVLSAGQMYQERGDDAYTGAVEVGAATVGHVYVAKVFR